MTLDLRVVSSSPHWGYIAYFKKKKESYFKKKEFGTGLAG